MTKQTAHITLTNDRLTLRPLTLRDAAWMADYAGDFEVSKMLSRVRHPLSRDNVEQFVIAQSEQCENEEGIVFAIITDEPVGCIGLDDMDSVEVELGYWVGRPFWRQGIATQAVTLLSDYVFETLGHQYLSAGHFKENVASARVLEKAGFCYTGEEDVRDCVARGHEMTCKLMRLTRENWQQQKVEIGQAHEIS